MVIIGQKEIERFVIDNHDLFAIVNDNKLIWGHWILIIPDNLLFNLVNEEKTYKVSCVAEWQMEDVFASDAGR